MTELEEKRERVILVAVALNDPDETERSLSELRDLADTAGAFVAATVIQARESVHPGTYIGKGKIEEVKQILKYIENLENAYGNDPVLTGVCMIDYSDSCGLAFEVNRDKMFNSENVIFNKVVEDNKAKGIKHIEAFSPFSNSTLYHLLGEFTRHL